MVPKLSELAIWTFSTISDEDFHDVIAERYERKSTIVTSNLDIPEWTEAFPNRIIGGRPSTAFGMGPIRSRWTERATGQPNTPKAQNGASENLEKASEKKPGKEVKNPSLRSRPKML
jgi:hypothetical protein